MSHRPESEVRLEVEPGSVRVPRAVRDEIFDVAILGSFSGRPVGGPLVPVAVDRDDLDDVLARFGPTLGFGTPGTTARLELAFRSMDDFHPDSLLDRVPLFRSIREMAAPRRSAPRESSPSEAPPPRPPLRELIEGGVLDQIVAKDAGEGAGRDPLAEWIEQVVAHDRVEPAEDGGSEANPDVVKLLADGVRALIHDESYQELEALWRGVEFVVRRVETDARLRIWLVDVSAEDLAREATVEASRLRDLLRRGAGPAGDPWSVVAATWAFGGAPEDLVALRGIARLCSDAGAFFLAGGRATLAGAPDLPGLLDRSTGDPPRLWEAFRREPEARSVGLLIPRVLMRLPYGSEADPCERLDFEEVEDDLEFERYLWGSPVFAAAVVLANAFRVEGSLDLWDAVRPDVGDLPLHVRGGGNEPSITPCTEVQLTEHGADRVLDAGLMPLVWFRGSDQVRIVRFQSVASPPSRPTFGHL